MKSGDEIRDLKHFLPEEATVTKQMTVDFANGHEPAFLVIAYQMRDEEGLRILKPDKTKGWKVVYKEGNLSEPVQDELILHTVRSTNGKEGLVVVYYHSGAGTTTDWKIIARSNGKFISRIAAPIRDGVLKRRHLIFGGYNGVRVDHDLIIETIAGYSPGVARCCPDQPPVEMRVKFNGTSMKLDSVEQKMARGSRQAPHAHGKSVVLIFTKTICLRYRKPLATLHFDPHNTERSEQPHYKRSASTLIA